MTEPRLLFYIGAPGAGKSVLLDQQRGDWSTLPLVAAGEFRAGRSRHAGDKAVLAACEAALSARRGCVVETTLRPWPAGVTQVLRAVDSGFVVEVVVVSTERFAPLARRVEARAGTAATATELLYAESAYRDIARVLPSVLELADAALLVDNSGQRMRLCALVSQGRVLAEGTMASWCEVALESLQVRRREQQQILEYAARSGYACERSRRGHRYVGPVRRLTSNFAAQQTGREQLVIHDLALLGRNLYHQQAVVIRYDSDGPVVERA